MFSIIPLKEATKNNRADGKEKTYILGFLLFQESARLAVISLRPILQERRKLLPKGSAQDQENNSLDLVTSVLAAQWQWHLP